MSREDRGDAPSHAGEHPTPGAYLRLRWESIPDDHPRAFPTYSTEDRSWLCHYELVLPLREYDIRREVYEDGEQVGEVTHAVIPMKSPTARGGRGVPCVLSQTGEVYADTPYRDGVHADYDATLLGGLPVFVMTINGALLPANPETARHSNGEDQ